MARIGSPACETAAGEVGYVTLASPGLPKIYYLISVARLTWPAAVHGLARLAVAAVHTHTKCAASARFFIVVASTHFRSAKAQILHALFSPEIK